MYRDYRRVDGYPDYIISNYGEVYSLKKYHRTEWRELKPKLDRNGYYVVCLFNNGKRKYVTIHILVGNNFIGKRTGRLTFDHIDQCKTNNRADNIRLASISVQNINKYYKPNESGQKHIYLKSRENYHYYLFIIRRTIDGKLKDIVRKKYSVNYYTLDDVIKIRDEFIKNNPSLFISV